MGFCIPSALPATKGREKLSPKIMEISITSDVISYIPPPSLHR